MGNPPLIVGLLINGAAYAATFVVVALLVRYFAGAALWRVLVVATLLVAAGLYVVFAVRAGEGTNWILTEAVGVAVFGGWGWSACLAGCGGSWPGGRCTRRFWGVSKPICGRYPLNADFFNRLTHSAKVASSKLNIEADSTTTRHDIPMYIMQHSNGLIS